MKRVIVTGATGFVGANLTRRLLTEGHSLFLFIRPASDLWRLEDIRNSVTLIPVSLSERELVEQAVLKIKPDWIFHLAVHGAYSWQKDLFEMVRTNIMGTCSLVEACLKSGFEAFINTGSSSEYGLKDYATSEATPLEPNSYYAFTKASASLYCRYIAQSRQVHLPTLRLYSVFGPYEDPGRLMPTLITEGLQGRLPDLVSPETARDFIYVEDVMNAYMLAATKKTSELGPAYSVGSGTQTSVADIVSIARDVFGIATMPNWGSMPARTWDSNVWVADNTKAKSTLGWSPKFTVAQGFAKMVSWFKDKPERIRLYEQTRTAVIK